MSLIWMDGFDLYASTAQMANRYSQPGGGSLVTGRFSGSQGWQCDQNGNGGLVFSLPGAAHATLTLGFAFYISGAANFSTGKSLVDFRNGSTTICKLGVKSDGALVFGRGDFTTNLIAASSAGLLSTNGIWHYAEVVLTRASGTSGAVAVYLDGTQVINEAATNTGASNIDRIVFGIDGAFSTTRIFDDLYIMDTASRVGERRIDVLRPSADTADKDWVASTGVNNYAVVDETTFNDDTDYVSSATPGALDLYDLANLSFTPANITAVQVTYRARKDDATTREVRANIKSGGTTANGATRGLTTSYQTFFDLYETDPNTSAAWAASAVNALQAGPEVVT